MVGFKDFIVRFWGGANTCTVHTGLQVQFISLKPSTVAALLHTYAKQLSLGEELWFFGQLERLKMKS